MIYLFLSMRDRFLCRRRSLSLALISLDRQLPLIFSDIDFFQNSELRMPNLPLGKVDSRRASAHLVRPSRLKFFVGGVQPASCWRVDWEKPGWSAIWRRTQYRHRRAD